MAGFITTTPYTLGYVELAYALQNDFTFAKIQNRRATSWRPHWPRWPPTPPKSQTSHRSTSRSSTRPVRAVTPSRATAGRSSTNSRRTQSVGTTLVEVLDWLTHAGQAQAASLDYVPLPANIQQLARTTLLQVTGPDGSHRY